MFTTITTKSLSAILDNMPPDAIADFVVAARIANQQDIADYAAKHGVANCGEAAFDTYIAEAEEENQPL